MAHFAHVDKNYIVTEVIVIEWEMLLTGLWGDVANWYQTSYNTRGGVHILGGTPYRKNYAGIGYKYDRARDAFIPPQPFASWILDEETCLWNPPIEYPNNGKDYKWSEEDQSWIEVNL
jgi:hypothetical protein